MRVVIADDSGIFRRGLRLLLEAAGTEVLADVADVTQLLAAVEMHSPDVCILDVKMPPTFTDEGVSAAERIRRQPRPVGVLLLSTYADTLWAERLLAAGQGGVGYLLKDHVDDVTQLLNALRRVAAGRTALDEDVVASLVHRNYATGHLDSLTSRERDVLELMARGLSNNGIATALHLSAKTVESYIATIFTKLDLGDGSRDQNRRVLAVLAFLNYST